MVKKSIEAMAKQSVNQKKDAEEGRKKKREPLDDQAVKAQLHNKGYSTCDGNVVIYKRLRNGNTYCGKHGWNIMKMLKKDKEGVLEWGANVQEEYFAVATKRLPHLSREGFLTMLNTTHEELNKTRKHGLARKRIAEQRLAQQNSIGVLVEEVPPTSVSSANALASEKADDQQSTGSVANEEQQAGIFGGKEDARADDDDLPSMLSSSQEDEEVDQDNYKPAGKTVDFLAAEDEHPDFEFGGDSDTNDKRTALLSEFDVTGETIGGAAQSSSSSAGPSGPSSSSTGHNFISGQAARTRMFGVSGGMEDDDDEESVWIVPKDASAKLWTGATRQQITDASHTMMKNKKDCGIEDVIPLFKYEELHDVGCAVLEAIFSRGWGMDMFREDAEVLRSYPSLQWLQWADWQEDDFVPSGLPEPPAWFIKGQPEELREMIRDSSANTWIEMLIEVADDGKLDLANKMLRKIQLQKPNQWQIVLSGLAKTKHWESFPALAVTYKAFEVFLGEAGLQIENHNKGPKYLLNDSVKIMPQPGVEIDAAAMMDVEATVTKLSKAQTPFVKLRQHIHKAVEKVAKKCQGLLEEAVQAALDIDDYNFFCQTRLDSKVREQLVAALNVAEKDSLSEKRAARAIYYMKYMDMHLEEAARAAASQAMLMPSDKVFRVALAYYYYGKPTLEGATEGVRQLSSLLDTLLDIDDEGVKILDVAELQDSIAAISQFQENCKKFIAQSDMIKLTAISSNMANILIEWKRNNKVEAKRQNAAKTSKEKDADRAEGPAAKKLKSEKQAQLYDVKQDILRDATSGASSSSTALPSNKSAASRNTDLFFQELQKMKDAN
ncbi:unnamed protein product [Amoebophrya sp. A120]|nr:unnamed protein product [Amoebophrya sp. A120]|eukprot:GSA120T00000082001.1